MQYAIELYYDKETEQKLSEEAIMEKIYVQFVALKIIPLFLILFQ